MSQAQSQRERRLRALALSIGILSLLATVAALLFGRRYSEPVSRGNDSYSKSAVGHRAFVETMNALGVHVVRFRTGDYEKVTAPLWFIEPSAATVRLADVEHRLSQIVSERSARGLTTVVVLPKWHTDGDGKAHLCAKRDANDLLDEVAPLTKTGVLRSKSKRPRRAQLSGPLGNLRLEAPNLQLLDKEPAATALASSADGIAILQVGAEGGAVILISEPDILHNFNSHRADHAQLLHSLVRDRLGADTIVVDEVFHGHGQLPSLGAALGEFPAVLLPLQFLFLALLTVWAGLSRFGPLRAAPAAFGRGPQEAISMGGSVLAVGLRPGALAADYVDRVLKELARHADIKATRPEQRAERLDALATRRGVSPRATWLLQQAHAVEHSRTRPREALRLVRAAWAFKRDVSEHLLLPSQRRSK